MSDHMQEVGRLADEYAQAVHDGRDEDCQQLRAALLAHIERGRVSEGDDGKRVLREVFALCEDTETQCSHAPEELNDFNRGRAFEAKGIARAIGAWYQEEFCGRTHMGEPAAPDHFLNATQVAVKPKDDAVRLQPYGRHCQNGGDACLASKGDGIVCPDYSCDIDAGVRIAPAPAEVPMPEPVGWYVSGSDPEHAALWLDCPDDEQMQVMNQQCDDGPVTALPIVLGADAKRYGDAREAAGYARGLAEAGSDAKRYRFITDDHADADVRRAVAAVCDAIVIRGKGATDAAIDALREKTKPAKCDGNHGGPRCADPECWQDPAGAVIDVRTEAERLVKSALAVGVVLTIETQPRQPLAMGHYDVVVQTREARKGGAA